MPLCASCGVRFSNWDEGCFLLFQTRSGQDDKFDLRSCALGQGASANTVLVGPIWRRKVFPGLPDASARNVVKTRSEVISRTVKDRDRSGAIFTTPRSNKHRLATDGPVECGCGGPLVTFGQSVESEDLVLLGGVISMFVVSSQTWSSVNR